ncbi:MAG: inositol monophosphatase, partial [Paramuribaculum sp.]|nr:inositol monophosphatase [Paramuribaculum sp.]
RWVIDPLDGTTNFGSGLPVFAVSIGVEYKGETVIGIVFAPYLNEFFHAVKGQGAFLNGKPVRPSETDALGKAVVATGFPVDKGSTPDNNLDNLERIMPLVRGIRRLGSAATEICYVAAGLLDAHWELNLHPWDVSAALLIADEAGARHRFFRTDRNISVVTASPRIFPLIDPLLSESARQ